MASDLFQSLQTALADTYQLERELGRGGMATVYLARDLKHPRHVAIKVLRPELAGAMTRGRFLREIRISAELTHPNILPLLNSGTIPPTDHSPALPYFTMPYVAGETLADRLRREKQLPLDDALAIAAEVLAALGYAHGRGIIHRDIKPGNILLMDGHAVVADFGIARAVKEAVDPDAVTSAGLVIGTPSYMSPEQATGDQELDGRSDLYSMGCVLYEMLAGEPPFTGATPQAVLARHRLDHAPSLRTLRASVPPAVEQAILRSLEKSPADRFATADAFVAALEPGPSGQWATTKAMEPRPLRRRRLWIPALVAAVLVAAWYLTIGGAAERRAVTSAAALDTTRYAIVSFGQDSSVPDALHPALLLQDALGRWDGIQVVDPFQVREAIARRDTTGYSRKEWDRFATQLGAGRYIRADASRIGDSIRIHAVLYSVAPGSDDPAIREHAVRIPADLTGRDVAFAELSERLLVNTGATGGFQPAGRTASLPARQAFEAGTSAINDWDLGAADSNFSAAVRFDPGYAQAHLWLALVRMWADPSETATWRSSAERAVAGRADLAVRDRQVAAAVLAQAQGDMLKACRQWRELTAENPYDFVVWYGLASCLYQDRTVVRDAQSPTGWRFQSSYHEALEAYAHAYRLLPPILKGFRTESYAGMVQLLFAGSNAFRRGQGVPPDPSSFYAFPGWAGDSLVLYPLVLGEKGLMAGPKAGTTAEAVRRQRQRLYDIARGWVTEYPASADALQALAVSLQLLGDRSALDTLEVARRLAQTPDETIRVATSEIWMRVLFYTPSGLLELRAARRLADSLLANAPADGSVEPMLLASLAALTGKAHLAARLGRSLNIRERPDTPPPLVGLGITFLTYAAMGGPVDSLDLLARQVSDALGAAMDGEASLRAREMWLHLPILVGFPSYQFPQVSGFTAGDGGLLDADAAYLRGDPTAAWQALTVYRRSQSAGQAFEMTIDVGYGTAWLMAALGRPDSAAAYLDDLLTALPRAQPQFFLEVYQAGPLVRAMALRAELADQLGDRKAARNWATAVIALWSGADAFLQPVVERMKEVAR
ncbi:MAG TPA: serine/threonine-protein kinase [Gemmatimonadales bacterium]|nr:serine/threonine-protein kinase [Gemmatimonadales bacterium]